MHFFTQDKVRQQLQMEMKDKDVDHDKDKVKNYSRKNNKDIKNFWH